MKSNLIDTLKAFAIVFGGLAAAIGLAAMLYTGQ